MTKNRNQINPITCLDYPDPDVIRVGDIYYMASTTMHFMPGCEILRSYDLVNWEHAAYVYETLDSTDGQCLKGDKNIYGKGMWAATLRYHEGKFYVLFIANDTHKTYLYIATSVEGPWARQEIEGFYYDASLLFDDDGKVYIVHGHKVIWLTELEKDLSKPKPGGLNRIIVSDEGNDILGYEGSHIYKINNIYYVFFIHSRRDRWMRVEACFMADRLDGEFMGGDCLEDTRGYCNQGVAQGGIVDTPEGDWYAMLFQDHGAAGRIPILVPITWEDNYPVFGDKGKIPDSFEVKMTEKACGKSSSYALVGSDDFVSEPDAKGEYKFLPRWQFNHEPWREFFELNGKEGYYRIITSKLCANMTEAPNTLTQRMKYPKCEAYVTIDVSNLKEGDYAGICALQGCYGLAAVTVREGKYFIVMQGKAANDDSLKAMKPDHEPGCEYECISTDKKLIKLKIKADFTNMKDEAEFFYENENSWIKIGITQKLYFKMDHFTGCRFGLFAYATKESGGSARFYKFTYI